MPMVRLKSFKAFNLEIPCQKRRHTSRNRKNSMRDKSTVTTAFEAACPLMLSYVAVGMACGVLAAKAGMTPWMSILLGFTYLSGGGQFMISNLWIAGTPMLSILASTAAITSRFALYSASLAPFLKNQPKRKTILATCNFTEESYGITLSKFAADPTWTTRHSFALSTMLQITWAVSCGAGTLLGNVLNVPTTIAGFAMTSMFIYLLYTQNHTKGNLVAIAAAATTVVICKNIGASGVAVPLAAISGVVSALLFDLLRRNGSSASHDENAER